MEVVGLAGNPGKKTRKSGIGPEGVDLMEAPGELRLGEQGVDAAVADLVQAYGRQPGAALQLGNEVVAARSGALRDGPATKRAEILGGGLVGRRIGPPSPHDQARRPEAFSMKEITSAGFQGLGMNCAFLGRR